jgi:hypothetical protein
VSDTVSDTVCDTVRGTVKMRLVVHAQLTGSTTLWKA